MRKWLLLLVLFSLLTNQLSAQRPGRKGKDAEPLPLDGKLLPDVTAVDENGTEFPLRQMLKGRHGVIVFGCLT